MFNRPKLAKIQSRNATLLAIAAHRQREKIDVPPLRLIKDDSIALYYHSGGKRVFKFVNHQKQ